jgi:acetyl esterase/lipase
MKVWWRGFAGAAIAAFVTAAAPAPVEFANLAKRKHPAPTTVVKYGADPLQVVDVWLPNGKGPFPTVIMIHGGCWQTSIADRHLMDWVSADLQHRGIAVWNIDYRGADRHGGGFPGTYLDVAAAADSLVAHAAEYRLDTKRVVAVGHSAGGHLALWLAARPRLGKSDTWGNPRPFPLAGVVSLAGLPDLERQAKIDNGCGRTISVTMAGGHPAETSVPRLAPLGVPQYLVNGLADRIVPTGLATDYRRRMRQAGDAVTIDWVPDAGHFDLIAPETRAWAVAVRDIERALKAH